MSGDFGALAFSFSGAPRSWQAFSFEAAYYALFRHDDAAADTRVSWLMLAIRYAACAPPPRRHGRSNGRHAHAEAFIDGDYHAAEP